MSENYSNIAVVVFAKAPVNGAVKTRLIPELGIENATGIHSVLTQNTLHSIFTTQLTNVQLWCAPDYKHDFFQYCASRWPLSLHQQKGENLGMRMHHALDTVLGGNSDYVIIVGTDCPEIDEELLQSAIRQLKSGFDIVISPAEDGGYVLMGARRVHPLLFENITWGSENVFEETCKRLNYLGWNWKQIEGRWDVDRPADVLKLISKSSDSPGSFLRQLLVQYVNAELL